MAVSRLTALLAMTLAAPTGWSAEFTDEWKEDFLRTAQVVKTSEISVGITRPLRATLEKDGFRHDAQIQRVDEFEHLKRLPSGIQIHFRDFWGFNVAAYRLDRMLGMGMVPVSVPREYQGKDAAFTWWVDDVLMMEKERFLKKIEPPDRDAWNRRMWRARVFNELTHNTDPNLGNVLITKDWEIRLVDYTRAFRIQKYIRKKDNLQRIDRELLVSLKALDRPGLEQAMGELLSEPELEAILDRRDRIVEFFEKEISEKGAAAVLYDYR